MLQMNLTMGELNLFLTSTPQMINEFRQESPVLVVKWAERERLTIMFNFLFNNKQEENVMARAKTSKTTKVRNLFNTGNSVTWKTLRSKFDLRSPASMVGKLRNEGMMIYENRTSSGVSYRVVPKT